jgi:hypothetical protein
MPLLKSWAPPGRRCIKPSATRAGHAHPQPPSRPPAGHRRPPASATASRPPDLGPGVCGPQPGRLPARERSPAELAEWVGREERTPALARMWRSGGTTKATPASPPPGPGPGPGPGRSSVGPTANRRLAGQRTSRPEHRHASRASRPDHPQPHEGRWLPTPTDPHQPDRPRQRPAVGSCPSPMGPPVAGADTIDLTASSLAVATTATS